MGSPFNSVITPSSLETIAGLIYKPTQHPAWAQFAFAYLMNAGGYTLALTEVASIIDQTGNFDDIDTSSYGVDVNSENADFNGLDTAQIQPDSGAVTVADCPTVKHLFVLFKAITQADKWIIRTPTLSLKSHTSAGYLKFSHGDGVVISVNVAANGLDLANPVLIEMYETATATVLRCYSHTGVRKINTAGPALGAADVTTLTFGNAEVDFAAAIGSVNKLDDDMASQVRNYLLETF